MSLSVYSGLLIIARARSRMLQVSSFGLNHRGNVLMVEQVPLRRGEMEVSSLALGIEYKPVWLSGVGSEHGKFEARVEGVIYNGWT